MQLVVPMAGLGSRFADEGYSIPKPLIPVCGRPMVVRAVEHLPVAERIVFVVHPDHVSQFEIEHELRRFFPTCSLVETPGLTSGQACTVQLAQAAVDPTADVLVAACDASHVYDAAGFAALRSDPSIDGIIWTYRGECRVLHKPRSYGWVRTAANGIDVLEVSCKRPISQDPLHDHVVSGFFWFRTAQMMFAAIEQLIASQQQVRGEYYLDSVPNLLLSAGRRVVVFEVDKYIGWGTPADLRDYECWQRHFDAIQIPDR